MAENKKVFSTEIAGRTFSVEVGELAKQANGACIFLYGDISVLVNARSFNVPNVLPFFPFIVNYVERLYAVGKIHGRFIKRDGRPSEQSILSSRLIDRPIRPRFPVGYRIELLVIST